MSLKDKILALQDIERAIAKHKFDDCNNVLSDLLRDAAILRREIQRESAGERAESEQIKKKTCNVRNESYLWE
jgi:hypothetical protein